MKKNIISIIIVFGFGILEYMLMRGYSDVWLTTTSKGFFIGVIIGIIFANKYNQS